MQNDSQNDLGSLLHDLKVEAWKYADTRFKWALLILNEKISIVFSSITYILLLVLVAMIILFFTFIGLAVYLGEVMNNPALGFVALALFSLLILVLIVIFRNRVKSFLLNQSILFLTKLENEAEEYNKDNTTENE